MCFCPQPHWVTWEQGALGHFISVVSSGATGKPRLLSPNGELMVTVGFYFAQGGSRFMVKATGSGVRVLNSSPSAAGSQLQDHGASHFLSLDLSFLPCKMWTTHFSERQADG